MKTDYRGQFAEGEIEARTLLDVIDAQAAEIERLKAALYSIDRQLGHDDADDALRDEITAALAAVGERMRKGGA